MTDDWINELAEKQLERDRKQTEEPTTPNDWKKFAALAEPFFDEVIAELRKYVDAYNESLGRTELVASEATHRTFSDRLQIRRSHAVGECRVSLGIRERLISTWLYYQTADGTGIKNGAVGLSQVGDGVRAETGDGSPAAAARTLLTHWLNLFD